MRDLKKLFGGGGSLKQFGILGALVVIIIIFQVWTGGKTLQPGNIINIVQQYSYILILAIGMVMVIIAGHIDLSVGSVAAFTGIIVALAMKDWNFPWWAAIILGLVVGGLIGAWQGFWVAYVGVPAFIVTLAGMLIWRGGNQFIGDSATVPVDTGFQVIGKGYLPEFGPNFGVNNATMLLGIFVVLVLIGLEMRGRRTRKVMGASAAPVWISVLRVVILGGVVLVAAYLFATGRVGTSFPVSGIILAVLVVAYSFLTNKTTIGRHIYAVGGNKHAAELSGVNSKRVNFFVMMNMSVLAALAGMIFVARSQASGPFDGTGWELDAIAAVFIGGAAVSGGIGTVAGSIIGGLVMAVLSNGLALKGIQSDLVQIIKGLVLLIAVGVDVFNKSQGRPSIIGLMTRNRSGQGPTDDAISAQVTPGGGTPDTAVPADLPR
ncbi:multiple monosaccharide ABC transporter permease [Cryobacterium arcticum]|uniref:Xylose transport system permease protein XylH n=1 Tax=Cryobacterium arcticum TaxID=670052 RepID=A0A318A4V3_9MICO|nr:multiple monosaccharide ABC transporter permease [Cryobacterium arcticum]PXA72367.1 sugar ABC transporter permease [Cryobacterium arcticum]